MKQLYCQDIICETISQSSVRQKPPGTKARRGGVPAQRGRHAEALERDPSRAAQAGRAAHHAATHMAVKTTAAMDDLDLGLDLRMDLDYGSVLVGRCLNLHFHLYRSQRDGRHIAAGASPSYASSMTADTAPTTEDRERAVMALEHLDVDVIKQEVSEIYAVHNPQRLGQLGSLYQKYAGREAAMLAGVRSKYGVADGGRSTSHQPPATAAAQPAQGAVMRRSSVEREWCECIDRSTIVCFVPSVTSLAEATICPDRTPERRPPRTPPPRPPPRRPP